MSLYNPQYKDEQGNIVDLPINAKKLEGYTYNEYSKYYTTSSTTENAFLVTIPYVKALSDGLVIHCQFHAATKSGATLNVNSLGAKGIYYRYATAITTHIVTNNYVDLIYSASIDKWVLLFSYDANSNTLGYQVRTNNGSYYNGSSTSCYRYQILVETTGGLEAFTSTSNSTGTSKTQLSPKYIPNGAIRYYSGTDTIASKGKFSATALWQQYQGINLKYSFNISTITTNSPCYIKMSRNTDGTLSPVYSATSGGHPLVFALPTTKDGYYYTYLGRTYTSSSTVYLELELSNPTFYYDGGIRVYDGTYLYDWAKASTKPTYTASEVGALPDTTTIPTKTSDLTNDRFVRYDTNAQGLNDTQKTNARTNIGAGTSNFTGYTSSNKLSTNYINNVAGWTSNTGTVTSVRVQAGTGLSSSTSTASTTTLDTTISIASGYKLLTTSEYNALNVQSDWNAGATGGLAYIKNKPYVLPVTNYTNTESKFISAFTKGRYINGSSQTIQLKTDTNGIIDWDQGDILSIEGNGGWLLEHWSATEGFQYISGNIGGSNSYFTGVELKTVPRVDSSTDMGDVTRPIYVEKLTNQLGYTKYILKTCNTYAGGTLVNLNGTSRGSDTATFYAPTDGGTSGQLLKSNGTGAPTWIDLTAGSNVSLDTGTANTIKISATDTKYSAGTGLTLSDTTFSVSKANVSTMLNLLDTGSSTPTDNDYYISQYVGGGTTTTSYHRRPVSALYTYMKGKFDSVYQTKISTLGSTTKPVYFSSNGVASECSTYAGGTAVTLNGTSKAASTASFYAPTSVGTNGQLLSSNGSSLVWTDDNRSLLHHDLGVIIENTTTDNGWSMFNSSYNGFLLKSVRFQSQSPSWGVGDFGAGIVFGGADTKGVVSVAYRTPDIKIAGGNGSKPVWWIGLTGTSATSYDLDKLNHNEVTIRTSGSISTGAKNMTSVTLLTIDSSNLTKGVWKYSGTYGVILFFITTAITTQGSPKTEYITGYVSNSIPTNTTLTLTEV